ICLAKKLQRPGTGSGLDFLRRRTANMRFPDIEPMLTSVNFAVIGAAATRQYMAERLTNDLDILVSKANLKEAEKRLKKAGATRIGELTIDPSQWTLSDGFHLDVIALEDEWVGSAITDAQSNRDLQGLPILPMP